MTCSRRRNASNQEEWSDKNFGISQPVQVKPAQPEFMKGRDQKSRETPDETGTHAAGTMHRKETTNPVSYVFTNTGNISDHHR